eukprot:TRINITY_DN21965_c0_g1_i2.p1 TRINITY_DN21965_c0_g1~~TRINITY_DN21965_c0_g1_i2.p1  ORF type:complete len:972 (+),score=119.48 TRINITY_DN21965_c0_g1_i2:366-2918(+)
MLKEGLLKKFECSANGFRKLLRSARLRSDESFMSFSIRLRHLADRWISLAELSDTSYEDLMDLFLREQFLQSVSKELDTYLCERSPKSLEQMTTIADSYRDAHPDAKLARATKTDMFANVAVQPGAQVQSGQYSRGRGQYQRGRFPNQTSQRSRGAQKSFGHRGRGQGRQTNQFGQSAPQCYRCLGYGHFAANCRVPPEKCPWMRGQNSVLQSGNVTRIVCSLQDEFAGRLDFHSGVVNDQPVSVLRDTGATVCGVRSRLVIPSQYTGEEVRCLSFGGRLEVFRLAVVDVESDFYSGPLTCCVIDSPVADLILGNLECISDSHLHAQVEVTAVTTRAQQKRDAVPKRPLPTVAKDLNISRSKLITLQKTDGSLKNAFESAVAGKVSSTANAQIKYFVEDDLLYRQHIKGGSETVQIMTPKELRPSVLATAHDLLLSDHCGNRRTIDRVWQHFFWPGICRDTKEYVRTCHTCQKATPKGRVKRVPLAKMPMIETPFQRVAIDLVGPLSPPSEEGHRFILTIIDLATRYPEAIPLKYIDTVSVAEALFVVFSRVGFPAEILSDQGTQFNSDLMKEFHRLLKITAFRTTPYHPQANGCVERFHGTLKAMLRKTVQKEPKMWHRFLPALLFACRELPSESTHFSPFELLFGRKPRGPVAILAEEWSEAEVSDKDAKPLYAYLFELKNKIVDTMKIATDNSQTASAKNKRYSDVKSSKRSFKVGNEVLVLLPSTTNKLLMEWKGPYKVQVCKHPDYQVLMGTKTKLLHANMLKQYHKRPTHLIDDKVSFQDTSGTQTAAHAISTPWSEITTAEPWMFNRKKAEKTSSRVNAAQACLGVVDDRPDDGVTLPTLPKD